MIKNRVFVVLVTTLFSVVMLNASAEEDRYIMCKRLAKEETGYNGPVPKKHTKKGGLFEGAAKGAVAGAAIGWVSGNSAGDAAKKGAALGGLAALIKKEKKKKKERKRNKKNRHRQEAYYHELNACMGTN